MHRTDDVHKTSFGAVGSIFIRNAGSECYDETPLSLLPLLWMFLKSELMKRPDYFRYDDRVYTWHQNRGQILLHVYVSDRVYFR